MNHLHVEGREPAFLEAEKAFPLCLHLDVVSLILHSLTYRLESALSTYRTRFIATQFYNCATAPGSSSSDETTTRPKLSEEFEGQEWEARKNRASSGCRSRFHCDGHEAAHARGLRKYELGRTQSHLPEPT